MEKYKYEIREIDAWNTSDGWAWNTSYHVGDIETAGDVKRAMMSFLRKKYGVEYGINDKVLSGFIDGDKAEKITRNTIYTNAAGRQYFVKHGTRYYFDEFVRC